MGKLLVVVVALALTGCSALEDLFGGGDDPDAGGGDFVDAAAPVDAIPPDAAPPRFTIGGRVANLLGTGLVLELDGGEQLAFDADGTFEFAETRLAGAAYAVTIATQPATQACEVRRGDGTIGAADVTDIVVACDVGALRITELSSCYFANVPCWLEVHNTSTTTTEALSDYRLRSTAAPRAGGTVGVREFTLPALSIPPGGHAVVRGRTDDVLVDGGVLRHVLDGGHVPYWLSDGFVELQRQGKTVDFVRFGASTQAPATIGWSGASAPALPGTSDYGAALARDAEATDSDAAADWALRAFATPGGVNDVTDDADADADGIPDQAEVSGGRFAGLDLFAMGARTGQRDIFVEVDHMTTADPGVVPRAAALDKVAAAFAAHGFALHLDAGSVAPGHDLGGGNALPHTPLIALGAASGAASLYALKAAHMDVRRQAFAHYAVFAEQLAEQPAGTAGIAELDGNDLIVALGFLNLTADTAANTNRVVNYQAATLMHELGHNLGLRHGGGDDHNYKSNYLSVMNYMYSFAGLPTIGVDEGDRYRLLRAGSGCATSGEAGLTNSPLTTTFVLDFSTGVGQPLDEAALVEAQGLRRAGSGGVDFDCSGAIAGTVAVDVVPGVTTLTDHDDWSNLALAFARGGAGASLLATPWLHPFADEVRPAADERGFAPPAR